jgi:hypothetical protein
MHIDRDFVLEQLRKQGKNEHVQKAIDELPEKIDHEQHAAMLEKLGIDPGKLAKDALEKGLGQPDGQDVAGQGHVAAKGANEARGDGGS